VRDRTRILIDPQTFDRPAGRSEYPCKHVRKKNFFHGWTNYMPESNPFAGSGRINL